MNVLIKLNLIVNFFLLFLCQNDLSLNISYLATQLKNKIVGFNKTREVTPCSNYVT